MFPTAIAWTFLDWPSFCYSEPLYQQQAVLYKFINDAFQILVSTRNGFIVCVIVQTTMFDDMKNVVDTMIVDSIQSLEEAGYVTNNQILLRGLWT